MTTNKRLSFTVDRPTWVTGTTEGESALLNDDGRMCCLGHLLKQAGFTDDIIMGLGDPSELDYNEPDHAILQDIYDNHPLAQVIIDMQPGGPYNKGPVDVAIRLNDDKQITNVQRERRLIELFDRFGVDLTFTGEPQKEIVP